MMRISTLVRPGLWGALAALVIGALALLAWGRSGTREEAVAPLPADFTAVTPPLDQQTPDTLETATFSLG